MIYVVKPFRPTYSDPRRAKSAAKYEVFVRFVSGFSGGARPGHRKTAAASADERQKIRGHITPSSGRQTRHPQSSLSSQSPFGVGRKRQEDFGKRRIVSLNRFFQKHNFNGLGRPTQRFFTKPKFTMLNPKLRHLKKN